MFGFLLVVLVAGALVIFSYTTADRFSSAEKWLTGKLGYGDKSFSAKPNFPAQFRRHPAHFLKSLSQSVVNFLLLRRVA